MLFKSITGKASSPGNNGPFMFPFYFGLDLINVTILVSVKLFSFDFFAIVVTQEVLGLCRNCGVNDIVKWKMKSVLGMGSGVFPLSDVAYLEELSTIAAVDSVSETMATVGLVGVIVGEGSAGVIFPTIEGCGMFIPCDENGDPEREIGEVFLVCIVAFFLRVVFFTIERWVFKRIMRYASKIEANSSIMSDSLVSLSSVVKTKGVSFGALIRNASFRKEKAVNEREKKSVETEEKNEKKSETVINETSETAGENSRRSALSKIRIASIDPSNDGNYSTKVGHATSPNSTKKIAESSDPESFEEDERITAMVNKVTSLLESTKNWRFAFFTKKTKTAVDHYLTEHADDTPGGIVASELGSTIVISRVTMALKTNLETLRADKLDFLNADKIKKGGERKILEVVNENIRFIYIKSLFPAPLKPRSSIFMEVIKDIELEGGRKATLICGEGFPHESMPEDPQNEVRLTKSLYADFYEEL